MTVVPLIVLGWSFVAGACVGSFLNVVAWRLPQHMSLTWPGSHCPTCRRPILFRDNVPVMGWLRLRGRCRNCGARISPRYPIVEFVTGTIFALLAWPELVGVGANLPLGEQDAAAAAIVSLNSLVWIWIYHAALMSWLVALALFEHDGAQASWGFAIAAILSGLVPPLVWPELHPVAWGTDVALQSGPLGVLATGVAGFVCGGAAGVLLACAAAGGRLSKAWSSAAIGLALCGAFLGWQAALTIACMAALALVVLGLVELLMGGGLSRPVLCVAVAALVQILGWRALNELVQPSGTHTPLREFAVRWVTVLVLCAAVAAIGRSRGARA